MAADDSGTRCSFFAFIRSAGIDQMPRFKSISLHRAPRASPERAAVKIANSKHRALTPFVARNVSMNGAI